MHQDARRGAPRQPRPAGRAVAGGDARARGPAGRGGRPAGRGQGGAAGAAGSPGRPAGQGASPDAGRITRLVEPVLRAMDLDLEAIKVGAAGRRLLLRITVDGDGGVSLDDIAEVSREVSARLDASDAMGDAPYTLEVSSPGVDRPLTEPRHWRRAAGRLVAVQLTRRDPAASEEAEAGPVEVRARVIEADGEAVTLQLDGKPCTVSYAELGPGRVQVEFGRLADADGSGDEAGLDDLGDPGESWDGPGEEGPDGH